MKPLSIKCAALWSVFLPILILGIFFRFTYFSTTPLEVDEGPNFSIAHSIYQVGYPTTKAEWDTPQTPYLFHPPIGYAITAGWFQLTQAPSIESARLLNIFASILMLVLAFEFMRHTHLSSALVALVFLATDAWVVTVGRMNYLENLQILLIIPAIWWYWKASKTGESSHYLLAGVLIGLTIVYKHIGIYLILAVFANWFLVRRNHMQHLYLLISTSVVIGIYELAMYQTFGDLFFAQQFVQFKRATGGLSARGMNFSPIEALEVIGERYWIYLTTIAALSIGWPLSIWRYLSSLIKKTNPVDTVLLSWTVGGLIFAVASRLKSPHYLILWLLPLYLYLAVELVRWAKGKRAIYIPVLCLIFVGANLFTWNLRFVHHYDDPLRLSATYINNYLPENAVVVTEPYLGQMIKQPYVDIENANTTERWESATYLALYSSSTASIESLPPMAQIASRHCQHLISFKGFKDTVQVCRLDPYLTNKLPLPTGPPDPTLSLAEKVVLGIIAVIVGCILAYLTTLAVLIGSLALLAAGIASLF